MSPGWFEIEADRFIPAPGVKGEGGGEDVPVPVPADGSIGSTVETGCGMGNNEVNADGLQVVTQQVNPGIKYEYMLPVGVASNLLPHSSFQQDIPSGPPPPPPLPSLPSLPPLGHADDYPNPAPSSGLGAKGGLLQTIQQGDFLAGIQNSAMQNAEFKIPAAPSVRSGSTGSAGSTAGVASVANSGPVPSSLSSSGSLANLGIQLSSNVPSMDSLHPATETSSAPTSSATVKSATRKRKAFIHFHSILTHSLLDVPVKLEH